MIHAVPITECLKSFFLFFNTLSGAKQKSEKVWKLVKCVIVSLNCSNFSIQTLESAGWKPMITDWKVNEQQ